MALSESAVLTAPKGASMQIERKLSDVEAMLQSSQPLFYFPFDEFICSQGVA
jgi:hypothetical protein